MTTTITKTVGSQAGDDYTTIQAAIDAATAVGGLVTADQAWIVQVRKGTYDEVVDIPDLTSDSTRFLTLTCVPGDEHKMVPGAGVVIHPHDGGPGLFLASQEGIVTVRDNFAFLKNLEALFTTAGSGGPNSFAWYNTAAGGVNPGENLIAHDQNNGYPFRKSSSSSPVTLKNCAAWVYKSQPVFGFGSSDTFINCTFVRSFAFTSTSNDGIEGAKAINCICCNHGTTSGHANFRNLAAGSSNNASIGGGTTTDPTTLFRTFTADTMDLHLKADAPAIGGGIGPASNSLVPTKDIDGDTRSGATTDIGADLYVAPAAPTFTGTIPDQSAVEGYPVSIALGSFFSNATSYSIDNLPDGMGFSPTTAKITGAATTDAVGVSVTSTITATNDTGSQDSNAFTWTITANQTPTIANQLADQTSNAATDVNVSLDGSITDADGGAITYSNPDDSLPPSLTVVGNAIKGTLTADSNTNSPYTCTIRGTDPGGADVDMTFTWTVNAQVANSPPTFDGPIPDQVWSEGDAVALDVSGYFADSDGEIVGYSVAGQPDDTSIDDNGLLSGTIASGASTNSPYSVVVTATDDGGKSTAATAFKVTVTAAAAKQFTVKLSSPTGGATLGTPSQATVTITT